MSAKDVKFGTDAREKMLRGVEILTECGEGHAGPKGRNVVIDKSYGAPRSTKDGVTVARRSSFMTSSRTWAPRWCAKWLEDQRRGRRRHHHGNRAGARIVREVPNPFAAGMNPMDLKRGVEKAVEAVVADLKKRSKKVKSTTKSARSARSPRMATKPSAR